MTDLRPRRDRFKKEITLLSRGYSDPKAWPGGKLTIFPWDNEVDTWLLGTSRRGATENATLYGLVEKLCDLNGGKIDNFVASEVMAVLLVARSIQSNCVLEYTSQCPNCRTTEKNRIVVPDELGKVGEKADGYVGWDEFILPDCKDSVRIRPLLVRDELITENRDEEDKNLIPNETSNLLRSIISIGGGEPETMQEVFRWYAALSPKDVKEFTDKQDEFSPHLDMRVPHKCDKCGHEYKHVLGLDKEFFR